MEKLEKYGDDEKLEITDGVGLTKLVKSLLESEKKRLKKEEGRKLSRSKIICNLVIEKYGNV